MKEVGNFIRTKFEDYNPGTASQKALTTVLLEVKAQLHINFFRQRAIYYMYY